MWFWRCWLNSRRNCYDIGGKLFRHINLWQGSLFLKTERIRDWRNRLGVTWMHICRSVPNNRDECAHVAYLQETRQLWWQLAISKGFVTLIRKLRRGSEWNLTDQWELVRILAVSREMTRFITDSWYLRSAKLTDDWEMSLALNP